MATRIYQFSPGDTRVLEGVGAASSSKIVEVTVDVATNLINKGTTTRVVNKEETILALEKILEYIHENNWPPV